MDGQYSKKAGTGGIGFPFIVMLGSKLTITSKIHILLS